MTIIPITNGAKTKTSNCINEAAWSILNSLDLEVIIVSQKIIVSGEIIEAKEVRNTDRGTVPPLM